MLRLRFHIKLSSCLCLPLLDSVYHTSLISLDGASFKNHLHMDLYPRVYFRRIRITKEMVKPRFLGLRFLAPDSVGAEGRSENLLF